MKKNTLFIFFLPLVFLSHNCTLNADTYTLSENSAAYLSGGIGEDEANFLNNENFNLKLIFATQSSGEYLTDINVTVENSKGLKVIETVSEGPHLYAKLPVGYYKITAKYRGAPIGKELVIKEKQHRTIYFYWKNPEEKT